MQVREYECFFCKSEFSRPILSPAPDCDTRNVLCPECHAGWLEKVQGILGFSLEATLAREGPRHLLRRPDASDV